MEGTDSRSCFTWIPTPRELLGEVGKTWGMVVSAMPLYSNSTRGITPTRGTSSLIMSGSFHVCRHPSPPLPRHAYARKHVQLSSSDPADSEYDNNVDYADDPDYDHFDDFDDCDFDNANTFPLLGMLRLPTPHLTCPTRS